MSSQTCTRCGWIWEINLTRNINTICESCRARKQSKISSCIIWQGHYAADMISPITDEGLPASPGLRKCGKKDCINPSHITKMKTDERK